MSEQPSEWKSACLHPEAVGKRWGDPISEERQAQLQALADRQREWAGKPEAVRGDSHFKDVPLTGADVFWLAGAAEKDKFGFVRNLHLEGANLRGEHLEGANLPGAHLAEAELWWASLVGADLRGAHLERANLGSADLVRVNLNQAHLEGALLHKTWLAGADLSQAYLEGAYLRAAHLEGMRLPAEQLQVLRQWQSDFPELLLPADLRLAFLSPATDLRDASLGTTEYGFAAIADVRWGGVNLAVVTWSRQEKRRLRAVVLGDERQARHATYGKGNLKSREMRLAEFKAAVRANRQLATALRDQGQNEDADRFAYRAQFLQRRVLRRQGHWGRALGSWLLDFISGYGYRPMRSIITYLLVVLGFAVAYCFLGSNINPPLNPLGAVVFSITSFHGRGFAPGENVAITNPITVLAAAEAIIGLLIEITFIATFTQRFFAR